jgi:hypothetical protein
VKVVKACATFTEACDVPLLADGRTRNSETVSVLPLQVMGSFMIV